MAEQSAVSWEVVVFKLLQRPEVPLLFPFDLFLNESKFIEKKKSFFRFSMLTFFLSYRAHLHIIVK